MHAEIHHLESNNYLDWKDFAEHQSSDPYDDFGWFHVTVGASEIEGGNDFQVCVATPRAVGRVKRSGDVPGILVDRFDAKNVRKAIYDRIESIEGCSWDQIVEQLRKFMRWEYEGMSGT
jgi:hypothetical protein